MGKGKGSLTRYCSRIFKNHNLFEFVGFNLKELIFLKNIFKKKVNIPLKIQSNFFLRKSYKITYNSFEGGFFNKKYNN
jgi:hypothetical protein